MLVAKKAELKQKWLDGKATKDQIFEFLTSKNRVLSETQEAEVLSWVKVDEYVVIEAEGEF